MLAGWSPFSDTCNQTLERKSFKMASTKRMLERHTSRPHSWTNWQIIHFYKLICLRCRVKAIFQPSFRNWHAYCVHSFFFIRNLLNPSALKFPKTSWIFSSQSLLMVLYRPRIYWTNSEFTKHKSVCISPSLILRICSLVRINKIQC